MILCAGEALIDMLPQEARDGTPAYVPHCGGAAFNTAIALGRLDADVALFSGVSMDIFGDLLAEALSAAGVRPLLTTRVERPTTLAFVTLVDGQAQYAFYNDGTALRMLTTDDLPALATRPSALLTGGISLMSDPCGSAFEALFTQSHAAGVPTMLDPNIRPGFIRDEAAYRARLTRMMACTDILKLSDEDLHWIAGDGEVDALAQSLLAQGPRLVVITRGADGATGYGAFGTVHRSSLPVTVIDTVGAGDTFNAGLLAALDDTGALARLDALSADDVSAALDLGTRAAAVTVSRAGANPPRRAELP